MNPFEPLLAADLDIGALAIVLIRSLVIGVVLGIIVHKNFQESHKVTGFNVRTSAQDKKLVTYITLATLAGIIGSLAVYFFLGF